MGSTIKYWIVANLGLLIWILILFMGVLDVDLGEVKQLFFGQQMNDPLTPKQQEIIFWGVALVGGGVFCLPTKKMGESLSRYFIFVFLMFYVFSYASSELNEIIETTLEATPAEIAVVNRMIQIVWIGFGGSHLLALLFAVYIYRNFDEVVSRRMLYRNSAVDMFEEQLKYTICQFMDHALAFYFLSLVIVAMLWFHSVMDGDDSFMGISNTLFR